MGEKELLNRISKLNTYLIYVMMELKAERQQLNATGVGALMYLRDNHKIEDVDLYIKDTVEFLDKNTY